MVEGIHVLRHACCVMHAVKCMLRHACIHLCFMLEGINVLRHGDKAPPQRVDISGMQLVQLQLQVINLCGAAQVAVATATAAAAACKDIADSVPIQRQHSS